MKKLFCIISVCLLITGCAAQAPATAPVPEDSQLRVVATLFPQYDFARRIAGEYASVQLLLPPGVESHSFDPTPSDIIAIGSSDLFLYTGEEMEPWTTGLLAGLDSPAAAIDLSVDIPLGTPETDPLNLLNDDTHAGHDHALEQQNLALEPLSVDETSENLHSHIYDPHIWTSPAMAIQMVKTICEALATADPAHAVDYRRNAADLTSELSQLDEDFRKLAEQSDHREMVFGSRFAVYYFAREYNISFLSPYDSCSAETEPAARTLAQVIDFVREHEVPVIYYQELSETRVAETIAEATGAKLLLFHSCHNLSKQEFDAGETYLSLMQTNLQHLKEGMMT